MNKIDPKKLLPSSKESAIQKKIDSSVLVPIKNIQISSKKITIPKEPKEETGGGDKLVPVVIEIKTKVIEIEKLLLSNNKLLRKQFKDDRKNIEDEKRREKESKLETKKSDKEKFPNLKRPNLPRTGIIDYIKNFLTWVIIGRAFVLFGKYLPKLIEFVKNLKPIYDFFKVVTGALFNGLVTFIEWTDKAGKKVREIVGALGGEPFQKAFDDFSGALTTFANLALIAGMATMGGSDLGLGDALDGDRRGNRRGRRGSRGSGRRPKDNLGRRITSTGFKQGKLTEGGWQGFNLWKQRGTETNLQTSENDIIKRYTKKYGRKNAINRFGEDRFKSLGGKYSRSTATNLARKGVVSVLGKGGTKAALTGVKEAAKVIKPLVRNLPLIGGIMEFILSWVSGDGVGKAAFKGIGAGLGTWIGAAIGSLIPIPGVGTGIGMWLGSMGGSALGEAIYDKIFNNKDPGKKGSQKAQKKESGGTIRPRKGKIVNRKARTKSKTLSKRLRKISIKKISPGKDLGGKKQAEKIYPNPDSPSFESSGGGFSWMDFLFGKRNQNEDEEKKKKRKRRRLRDKNKIPNATKALLGVAERLERSANWMSYLMRAGIEVAMGQMPDVKSLASMVANVFSNLKNSGASAITKELIGFAEGGEISPLTSSSLKYFQETLPLERTIEKDLRTSLKDSLNVVKNESRKKGPTGRDEMLEDNRRKGKEPDGGITTLGTGGGSLKDLTDQDYDDLAYIVSGEAARGTDDEYGVAAAVLNRVASPVWPNTIMGVGTQQGQFEAVEKGTARRDPALAKKLKDNQGKIADALKKLNGRDSFKGQSQLDNKGASDIMFDPRGNFYHYRQQVRKSDPEPTNIDQSWKKLLGPSTGGSFSTPSGTPAPGGNLPAGSAGSKIAGELGRFMKKKGVVPGSIHRHPEHPPYSLTSGHSRGSLHYQGRAIDLGGYANEQGPILKAIAEFNRINKVKPVQLLHAGNDPTGQHNDHVHVAYEGGGALDPKYKKINTRTSSLNSYDDESDIQLVILPMMMNTDQNRFAISTPPRISGGSVRFTTPPHNLHR